MLPSSPASWGAPQGSVKSGQVDQYLQWQVNGLRGNILSITTVFCFFGQIVKCVAPNSFLFQPLLQWLQDYNETFPGLPLNPDCYRRSSLLFVLIVCSTPPPPTPTTLPHPLFIVSLWTPVILAESVGWVDFQEKKAAAELVKRPLWSNPES